MPILKSYVNDEGYYINARPSDVGNVTYQIDPTLWTFFEEMGYGNESEIEWSLVKSFRMAGLIYTEGSGVDDEISEEIPELDPSKLSELSESELEEILQYIESREDLDPDLKQRIRDYVLQRSNGKSKELSSEQKKQIRTEISTTPFELPWELEEVTFSEATEQDVQVTVLGFGVRAAGSRIQEPKLITHTFTNAEQLADEAVSVWRIGTDDDITWEMNCDVFRQQAVLLNWSIQVLEDNGHDVCDPDSLHLAGGHSIFGAED